MKIFMKLSNISTLTLTLTFILLSLSAFALSPEARLPDEAQEQRAMQLFLEVRCLICGGQVIENSNTEFSYEMRKLIRQKISSGLTNEEIKTELVKEFGEDILTSANQKTGRFFLWCLPVLFMVSFYYNLVPASGRRPPTSDSL
jgi:cytochrome c-type biogenesis protein CcmH